VEEEEGVPFLRGWVRVEGTGTARRGVEWSTATVDLRKEEEKKRGGRASPHNHTKPTNPNQPKQNKQKKMHKLHTHPPPHTHHTHHYPAKITARSVQHIGLATGEIFHAHISRGKMGEARGWSVTAISTLTDGVVAAWADGTIRIIRKNGNEIKWKGRGIVLAIATTILETGTEIIALATTNATITIHGTTHGTPEIPLITLLGHTDWVRAIAFNTYTATPENSYHTQTGCQDGDVYLASASQDRYIRLWRFTKAENYKEVDLLRNTEAHMFETEGEQYVALLDAVLMGHDDWVNSIEWAPHFTTIGKHISR